MLGAFEQIFGANQQVPHGGGSDKEAGNQGASSARLLKQPQTRKTGNETDFDGAASNRGVAKDGLSRRPCRLDCGMWKAEMNTLPEITNVEVELSDNYGQFCVSFEHDGMRYHVWIDEKTGTIKPVYGPNGAKANLPLIAAMMKAIVDGDLYRKAYKVAVMKELDECGEQMRIRQDEKARAAGPLLLEACRDALSYLRENEPQTLHGWERTVLIGHAATVAKLEATIKLAEGEQGVE
jgi:hypothetical protein